MPASGGKRIFPIQNVAGSFTRKGKAPSKMLALMPGLRVATSEREKSTLQNTVSATDRQIDELVYELCGLTPEEIALVESSA